MIWFDAHDKHNTINCAIKINLNTGSISKITPLLYLTNIEKSPVFACNKDYPSQNGDRLICDLSLIVI